MNPNVRWVYGVLVVLGLLLLVTVVRATSTILGWLNVADYAIIGSQFTVSTLVGLLSMGVAAYFVLRTPQLMEFSLEVVAELKRVSWPERQETFAATIVVIVTIFIASIILGFFDLIWAWLTDFIYN